MQEGEALRDALARQHALENESRALGSSRYQSRRPLPWRTEAAKPEDECDLPPGRQLLRLAIGPTAEAIREWVDRIANGGAGHKAAAYGVLSLIGADEAAYLTGRIVVNAAASRLPLTQTAIAVAQAFIEHIEMAGLKAAAPQNFKGLERAVKQRAASDKRKKAIRRLMREENVALEIPLNARVQTGMKAIELFCEATGLFVTEAIPHHRGQQYVVRPTDAAQKWFDQQHARCELLEPIHMPMLVRPKRWRSPFVGGYLTRTPGHRLVKQWNADYHDRLRDVEMPAVYDAINAVQDVAWRINEFILDTMREVWDGGGSLGGLPCRDDLPLPAKPDDFDTDEAARKAWKRESSRIHQDNAKSLARRLAMSQRLWIATKFRAEDAIWFPHELDFRGRIYPVATGGPHPQADDAGKALLQFAEGKPLGHAGAYWLAIHIANLFGQDKLSLKERFDWLFENEAAILDSAANPLDGDRFWTTADQPWQALAACHDWLGYYTFGPDYESRTPIALDGANSGLQHFSALLRDPVGARAVNLIPGDRPQDIYAEVAAKAQARADAAEDPSGKLWANGRLTRRIAKRPCMTFVYSATRFGMQDMIAQTLWELDREATEAGEAPHLGDGDNYAAAHWASYALWDSISETVVAASMAMDWLREAAKVACRAGVPIKWTTPAGLPVLQHYRGSSAKRVNVFVGGRRILLHTRIEERHKLNTRAQVNGIAPNFIHSLDAAHLMAVARRCRSEGVGSLAVVHDSFGTHAADTDRLAAILRDTFVEQYTPDLLARFRDELAAQLPADLADELPPLPTFGDLDLGVIRQSDYLFS